MKLFDKTVFCSIGQIKSGPSFGRPIYLIRWTSSISQLDEYTTLFGILYTHDIRYAHRVAKMEKKVDRLLLPNDLPSSKNDTSETVATTNSSSSSNIQKNDHHYELTNLRMFNTFAWTHTTTTDNNIKRNFRPHKLCERP